jgi:hypothetical protein
MAKIMARILPKHSTPSTRLQVIHPAGARGFDEGQVADSMVGLKPRSARGCNRPGAKLGGRTLSSCWRANQEKRTTARAVRSDHECLLDIGGLGRP